uniref:Ribonuclease E n=1 Tax=Rhodomonas salina TaxID=3034 RepID=A6MVU3_RHDSA|nr:ribonuclease E [Rhodomonas salina]ABO70837.1 ribonuclease E [Rhodomonas salina]
MVKTLVLAEQNKIGSVYDNDTVITQLIIERGTYHIGDIYIGIVETVLPSINAAFIILDYSENNGFIHINNLGHLKKKTNSTNITNHLSCNSIVMVQVLKEPNGQKGPTVTGDITLRGRYLTLLPFEEDIFFSRDFESNENIVYLRLLFTLLKPKSTGILINKKAIHASINNIIQDFYSLLYEWDSICHNLNYQSAPFLISRNKNFISKVLQKVYSEKVDTILVDSKQGSKKIASTVTRWIKQKNNTLSIKYFENHNFFVRDYNLDLIVYDLLQSRINLLGGGYIIIEKTEALTTIDVNSGSFNYLNNPRETILLVNRKAAKQIARHLRLRNISGVIIVDFIDMKNQQDQLALLLHFDSFLKQDEQRPRIIQFSELGLVELTRKRQGRSLLEMFSNSNGDLSNRSCISSIVSQSYVGHTALLDTCPIYSR